MDKVLFLLGLQLWFSASVAHADTGEFSTLTYNVAGLPELVSSADSPRQAATEEISCYINAFDVANVQEDFNYHAALYDTCSDHPFRSPTSGGAGVGSGLNTMSRFWYTDWARVSWDACNGVDCLTPKGFTLARVRLAEGIYVDVYNLHTQAQTAAADLAARRDNILQLLDYIELNSAGHAVIVMGDTNTRYTRTGDNIGMFLDDGFSDAWIELVRGGDVPRAGTDALVCDIPTTGANCEIVDKVLYRDNGYVGLWPTHYEVRQDAVTAGGSALSDHPPVAVAFAYNTPASLRLSDPWGGPHGYAFSDVGLLPDQPEVRSVALRSGARLDRVELTLESGEVFAHGGMGGSPQALQLDDGEHVTGLRLCAGQHNGRTRIFHAAFQTSGGRSLAGGESTADCTTYTAPAGWQIVGFHGRSGDEVDKLGAVYAPAL